MSKIKAAGIHALISIFVVTAVLMTMYLLWYPGAYFKLMGGQTLIVLIALVDVFLGPLLTFIVFKAGKKSLRFDLACIGLLQIAALSYGVYVMFISRPVFTVFNKERFQIAAVVDIAPKELAKAKNADWRTLSIKGPTLVAIGEPDKNDKTETMFAMVESKSAFRYPKLYEDYAKHVEEVIKAGKPLTKLTAENAENRAAVARFIQKNQRPESDFLYLPITSELAEMTVMVDAKSGELVAIIDARE